MNLSAAYVKKKEEWREDGIREGIQEGIQQGIQEGIQQGIQQGEQRGTYKVASNLLRQGMSVELVSQVTELTIEQINHLRGQLG